MIVGASANAIVQSVRAHIDAGRLSVGESLPPVRVLAEQLGVNRNTVSAAYRALARAGAVVTRAGAGTTVVGAAAQGAQEGFAPTTVLRDLGSGNPDPLFLPDLDRALPAALGHTLYGDPPIDPALATWATSWLSEAQPREFGLTVTAGAVDAVERLLGQALTTGDAVGLEDPCFLSSINTVRIDGYQPVAIPVDEQGMTSAGLSAALKAGVRAVVCTPRAHNPTGASLTQERAKELRDVLKDYPNVLVIEDDHFSMLAGSEYHSIIGDDHQRWALVRSVSKFFGPDLRLALVASDTATASRLGMRLAPGSTWVSHLLQRVVAHLASDPRTWDGVRNAAVHYAQRNEAFRQALSLHGIDAIVGDGLNVWLDTDVDASAVSSQLMQRGWLVRTGDAFRIQPVERSTHIRLTIHELGDDSLRQLASDVADAIHVIRSSQLTGAGR